jgi:hypothetical protein
MLKPIQFLKSKCFPMTITVTTSEFEDVVARQNVYITTITDDQEMEIAEFRHIDLRARIHWVDGFFKCHRMFVKENNHSFPF